MSDGQTLRANFDSKEPIIGGNQTRTPRRRERTIPTPEWMHDDKAIQKFLLDRFPQMKTNLKQAYRVGIWAYIIVHYFRNGEGVTEIAEARLQDKLLRLQDDRRRKLFWSGKEQDAWVAREANNIKQTVRMIRCVVTGLRTDGKSPTGRKPGRPKREVFPPRKYLVLWGNRSSE